METQYLVHMLTRDRVADVFRWHGTLTLRYYTTDLVACKWMRLHVHMRTWVPKI